MTGTPLGNGMENDEGGDIDMSEMCAGERDGRRRYLRTLNDSDALEERQTAWTYAVEAVRALRDIERVMAERGMALSFACTECGHAMNSGSDHVLGPLDSAEGCPTCGHEAAR